MMCQYKDEAKKLLSESLELTLRPERGNRIAVLTHAFEFLSAEYGEEVVGEGWVINEAHISRLIRELKELGKNA